MRKHKRSGGALGDDSFVEELEGLLAQTLKPQKPGAKVLKVSSIEYGVPRIPRFEGRWVDDVGSRLDQPPVKLAVLKLSEMT